MQIYCFKRNCFFRKCSLNHKLTWRKVDEIVFIPTYDNMTSAFQDGDTLLHLAVRGGQLKMLQLLLEKTEIDPTTENKVMNNNIIYRLT